MFCAPGLVLGGTEGVGPVFMFCTSGLIFCGTEGAESRFDVLRSRTPFRRYRGRQIPLSCFTLPDSVLTIPRAPGPVFMFRASRPVLGGNEGVGSHFHVLHIGTDFRGNRGRRPQFSYFITSDLFSAVPRASGPVFMFCTPKLVFYGTEDVGSLFHV
jgi:hypothetical protein